MSYHGAPGTNPDGVRLLVGDIAASTADEFLDDAAYTFFLAQSSNNLYLAAQLACQSLASLFASTFLEKKVGDLLLKRGDITAAYKGMAKDFAAQALVSVSPSAGGISKFDRRAYEQDQDRISPFFRRRLFDSLYAIDPAISGPGSTYSVPVP